MACTRFLVDIRKHRGDSKFVVDLVRRFCSRSSGATIDWLVRSDQADLIPPESIIGTAEALDRTWGTRLRDHLVQISQKGQNAADGAFCVLSYDNWVVNLARTVSCPLGPVTAMHISELFKMGIQKELAMGPVVHRESTIKPYIARQTYNTSETRHDRFRGSPGPAMDTSSFTFEDAVRLTKQALRNGGHASPQTGLLQKELRPTLCSIDFRAGKQRGNAASELLIPRIVEKGLREGWLQRFRGVPGKTGTEIIYLVEEGNAHVEFGSSENTGSAIATLQRASSAIEAHTTTQADRAAVDDNDALPVVPQAGEPSAVAEPASARPPKHPNRATQFEGILSKSRIGAMPETRERFFDALELEFGICQNLPLPLLELFANASIEARRKAEADGYTVEKNWHIAEMCIRRLMQWSGVLIGEDGQPVSDRIGSNAKKVSSLQSDFRRTCEAYLIEHIIEKSGGVNYDDETYYLGLTIYRRGKEKAVAAEELKSKADAILSHLEENGRILLDGDRMLRIKQPRGRSFAIAG